MSKIGSVGYWREAKGPACTNTTHEESQLTRFALANKSEMGSIRRGAQIRGSISSKSPGQSPNTQRNLDERESGASSIKLDMIMHLSPPSGAVIQRDTLNHSESMEVTKSYEAEHLKMYGGSEAILRPGIPTPQMSRLATRYESYGTSFNKQYVAWHLVGNLRFRHLLTARGW
jgi:hypothetical protein